jgi:tetratricopeptide (TPR) repeat protein
VPTTIALFAGMFDHAAMACIGSLLACTIVTLGLGREASAEEHPQKTGIDRDQAREEKFYRELNTDDPTLIKLFKVSTSAMDYKDYEAAIEGFQAVLKMVPIHAPSLRRLSFSYAELGRAGEALMAAEKAEMVDPDDPDNIGAMALALSKQTDETLRNMAVDYAQRMLDQRPGAQSAKLLAHTSLAANNRIAFDRGVDALSHHAPEAGETHALLGLRHALDNDLAGADKELGEAVARGYPKEEADRRRVELGIVKGNPASKRHRLYAEIGGGVLVGLGLIVAASLLRRRQRRRRAGSSGE